LSELAVGRRRGGINSAAAAPNATAIAPAVSSDRLVTHGSIQRLRPSGLGCGDELSTPKIAWSYGGDDARELAATLYLALPPF
jgi:hypothetical protein